MPADLDPDGLPIGFFSVEDIQAYQKMAALVPDGGTIVEVGCYQGRSMCSIGQQCKARGILLVAVDGWGPNARCLMRLPFEKNIRRFGFADSVWVIQKSSLEAVRNFAPATVDMVFLDAGHEYDDVKEDIEIWLPIVNPGGFLAGHDYRNGWPGVEKAVHDCLGPGPAHAGGMCWVHHEGAMTH